MNTTLKDMLTSGRKQAALAAAINHVGKCATLKIHEGDSGHWGIRITGVDSRTVQDIATGIEYALGIGYDRESGRPKIPHTGRVITAGFACVWCA